MARDRTDRPDNRRIPVARPVGCAQPPVTIQLLVPPHATGGNQVTATRYTRVFGELGHRVLPGERDDEHPADVVVAIHAAKCHEALAALHRRTPALPVVVVLAGTDIYPAPGDAALASMQIAQRLVILQDRARAQIPPALRDRTELILQSAQPVDDTSSGVVTGPFPLCVVGHLRGVKDPLRAAAAARLLPPSSRIEILHAGRILEERFRPLVESEMASNPRYRWIGELTPARARALIAECRLQVLSSRAEGGAQVLSESIVCGTPLLAARNDAARSILGDDYPGLFAVGDTVALAALMERAENDPPFLAELALRTRAHAPRFAPERERLAWEELLAGLSRDQGGSPGRAPLPSNPSPQP